MARRSTGNPLSARTSTAFCASAYVGYDLTISMGPESADEFSMLVSFLSDPGLRYRLAPDPVRPVAGSSPEVGVSPVEVVDDDVVGVVGV
jgi:hypothetical protein